MEDIRKKQEKELNQIKKNLKEATIDNLKASSEAVEGMYKEVKKTIV